VHALKALHTLEAARSFSSDREIEEVAGIRVDETQRDFEQQAAKTMLDLAVFCPLLQKDQSLSAIYSTMI